jgi:hypothetical protein
MVLKPDIGRLKKPGKAAPPNGLQLKPDIGRLAKNKPSEMLDKLHRLDRERVVSFGGDNVFKMGKQSKVQNKGERDDLSFADSVFSEDKKVIQTSRPSNFFSNNKMLIEDEQDIEQIGYFED